MFCLDKLIYGLSILWNKMYLGQVHVSTDQVHVSTYPPSLTKRKEVYKE